MAEKKIKIHKKRLGIRHRLFILWATGAEAMVASERRGEDGVSRELRFLCGGNPFVAFNFI